MANSAGRVSTLYHEHRGRGAGVEWAGAWFGRVFDYVEERFSLRQYGYPLYLSSGDRKVSYVEHVGRKEHYHHPRCVMRNLLALERMIERGGEVSGFWNASD